MKKLLDIFLRFEDGLIERSLKTNYNLDSQEVMLSDELIHKINANLLLTTEKNLAFKTHRFFIDSLISYYLEGRFKNYKQLSEVFNFVNADIDVFSEEFQVIYNATKTVAICYGKPAVKP